MTVVSITPKNHPQQVANRGPDDDADDRRTPNDMFRVLHFEHRFTVDVAASSANAKLLRFYDREADGLGKSWAGETVWCNPPYSDLASWVAKAIHEVSHGCPKVVMLLPADRTEQPFWQRFIEPLRDSGRGIRTRFLPGRPSFGSAATPEGKKGCPFGVVVVVFEERP